jgi:hypothetical protein
MVPLPRISSTEPTIANLQVTRVLDHAESHDHASLETPLPASLNYAIKLDPVPALDDQNPLGQLGAALMQFHTGVPMSEVYLNEVLGTRSRYPNVRHLMDILQEHGCVTSRTYASRPAMDTIQQEARRFRVGSYASLPVFFTVEAGEAASSETVRAAQASLYHNGPALLTTAVYNYGPHPWKRSAEGVGSIPIGGAAFLIVGYNGHEFLLRAAWGSRWGPTHDGYTTYPYTQFLRQYHWDVYTVLMHIHSTSTRDGCAGM